MSTLCAVACGEIPPEERIQTGAVVVGSELGAREHLENGQELVLSSRRLIEHGRSLFVANFTVAEGQGRPLANGAGQPLADPSSPLVFPREGNRISGPDTSSCSHCHNTPNVGGGGDVSMGVFVLGERFDFATFDRTDAMLRRGSLDERGQPATLQSIANFRKPVGMGGSGYIEMLSRQLTRDLRAIAASCGTDQTCALTSKGISFGAIRHNADGTWDTSQVVGLGAGSLATTGTTAPSLTVLPFSQAGASVSLRDFTNTAFNRHHGVQAEERVGHNVDGDGDGVINELTRADVTAVIAFEATLPVPGRVIPSDPAAAAAVAEGETLFASVGCGSCHIPALPLDDRGWVFSEPNPYNPPSDLRPQDVGGLVRINLARSALPGPRLKPRRGVVTVEAYTDFKLHDITTGLPSCASNPQLIASGGCDGNTEPLDQHAVPGSPAFFAGNHRFITRKLWGIANQHTFGTHGQFTTMRESIGAHHGEANASRLGFEALSPSQQAAVIEFLKSLQILPPGAPCRVIDDHGTCRETELGDPPTNEDLVADAADDADERGETRGYGLPNVAQGAFLPRHAIGIGNEASGVAHLQNGEELTMSAAALAEAGRRVFSARYDATEGMGRPGRNGVDAPLHDPTSRLAFPHLTNRFSGPPAMACSACHNTPIVGGGGDIIGSVNPQAPRFDFLTFDPADTIPLRGTIDERGIAPTLQAVTDVRRSVGMSGAGFIEMLQRQMTLDLQAGAAACAAGSTCPLTSKGVSFGSIIHNADGTWNTSQVLGLPAPSLVTTGTTPPNLIIRPFFTVGAAQSLRLFTNNAFARLQGMEMEERFGTGVDPDGDGVVNELTRADITAIVVFQATLAPPGRLIPSAPRLRQAVARGEALFSSIGCASCHIPSLPLTNQGWIYSEPSPFNPAGNLRLSDGVPPVVVDLTDPTLPGPRLTAQNGVVAVPAYTDMKLHDITTGLPSCASNPQLIPTGGCDGNVEPLDQNASGLAIFNGNRRFMTRKLWGIANQEARFMHHGAFTSMREAIVRGHFGEALQTKLAYEALASADQDAVIEFLKSLQVLPPNAPCSIVDDHGTCLPADWAQRLSP